MNRKNLLTTIVFSLLFLHGNLIFAQKTLSSIDQSLRYSLYSRIGLKIVPLRLNSTEYRLQFVVEKIEENPSFDSFSFSYAILGSYEEEITPDKTRLLVNSDLLQETDRHWFFQKEVEIPENQETAIAILTVLDTRQGDEYVYHLDLKSPYIFETPNLGLYFENDIPFDQNYLNSQQSILIKTARSATVNGFYYPVNFDVPFPPMETRPAEVPKELNVISMGDFLANVPKELANEGYYFFQTDTLAKSGNTIRVVHEAFPKVKDWQEMVQMVTYISTRKEHETLLLAQDKKKALDEYWINLTRNPEVAKELIRNYFRMVEFSNILFTDFKEGWKTDRGMVFIVMGPPQQVNFYLDREVWTYAGIDDNSKIRFTFARTKTILTPHYYTLNRSRAYQPVWFKNISQWRSGRMAF